MPQPDLAVIEPHPTVTVMENGIQYEVNFNLSQKTGLFFDQRVNREKLKALSQGRRVLDLYCYAGGFSLAAAQGGASYVLGIDSSAGAIQMAQRNAVLNGFTQVEFSEEDAVKAISKASDFDLIILDPPKLVPSRTHLPQAIRYYEGLHRQVFAAMKPGAMLLTCSCSSAITQALLIQIVRDTAAHLRKTVRILDCLGAGSDHPMLPAFPEGQYLQGLVVMLEN
jgi:23S rRNA (cytosine1962-C5)-methyltransferase